MQSRNDGIRSINHLADATVRYSEIKRGGENHDDLIEKADEIYILRIGEKSFNFLIN